MVVSHCCSSSIRLTSPQGVNNRRVFVDSRLYPLGANLGAHRSALGRSRASIPQHLDGSDHSAVLGCAGDQLVKAAVRVFAFHDVMLVLVEHFSDEHFQLDQLALVDAGGSQCARYTNKKTTNHKQLKRTDVGGACLAARGLL